MDNMIRIKKATGAEDRILSFFDPIAYPPGDKQESYRQNAKILFDILINTIPGGTYDRLVELIKGWEKDKEEAC